jgi:signal transduction histidine kinase
MLSRDDLLDWGLAAGVAAIAVGEQHGCDCPTAAGRFGSTASIWLNAALLIAVALPLGLRRRLPVAVWMVTGSTAVLRVGLGFPNGFLVTFPVLVAVYSVAANATWRYSLAAAVLTALVLPVNFAIDWANRGGPYLPDIPYNYALFGSAWILGDNLRQRRERVHDLEERARSLQAEQEERERRAVGEERARIARELHDLVAHSLSVIVLQAGAARRIVAGQPARAGPAFSSIEGVGREALAEMRRLVGILRKESAGSRELEPQPSLARLDELVERVRAAGLEVSLREKGERPPLPPGVDLSAFRIVQEALTNTLQHARASQAEVAITYEPRWLEVLVTDDGVGTAGNGEHGGGQGLIGMRERVAMFGGELDTTGPPGGGFRIRATLPIESADT